MGILPCPTIFWKGMKNLGPGMDYEFSQNRFEKFHFHIFLK